MRTLGLIALIAGAFVLLNRGYSYTKTTKIVDAGPIQASVDLDKHVYLQPRVGVGAVLGGIILLGLGRRRERMGTIS